MTDTFKITALVFVYNAKGGLFNAITDYIHKNISPQTYECNLCAITYDNLGMKKTWQKYLKDLPIEKVFLHQEEFVLQFPEFKNEYLPLILAKSGDKVKVLLTSQELNKMESQEELIGRVEKSLRVM